VKLTVILLPEADGGYSVVCPALPGCVSEGDSLDEAMVNIREAIEASIDLRRENGFEGPVESPEIIAREIERCLEDRTLDGLPLTIETREVELPARTAA
jgi:predicted RNase H-like HicB family nuclease